MLLTLFIMFGHLGNFMFQNVFYYFGTVFFICTLIVFSIGVISKICTTFENIARMKYLKKDVNDTKDDQ